MAVSDPMVPHPALLGTFEASLSTDGWVRLPAPFQGMLHTGAILTCGFDQCLHILTPAVWQMIAQHINNVVSPEGRTLRRYLFASAVEVVLDDAGYLHIPADLRAFAGVTDQVVFAGLGSYVEVWSHSRWHVFMDTLRCNPALLAETYAHVIGSGQ